MAPFLVLIFLLGLAVGSFLNVCIHRIPKRESIIFPGSRCPYCRKPIKFYDNIPVLSYLILKGRCRYCHKPISPRYLIVELLTGILFVLIAFFFGINLKGVIFVIFISLLIIAAFIDVEHFIIPDAITLPGIVIGILGNYFISNNFLLGIKGALVGGVVIFTFRVFGFSLRKREMMGLGDVKFATMIGAFLGWKSVLLVIFFSAIIGAIIWYFLIIFQRRTSKDQIPFGFFLTAGSLLVLFIGEMILNWYWNLFR